MGIAWKYILYCCFVLFARGAPTSDEDTTLVQVSVIFRHGARTTYAFYPTDPNQEETFYPTGLGGLTNEGKQGEYELGQYLKNHYGEFIGDVYTEDLVEARSSDVTRTKMSALLVLAGLFPPSEIQKWNNELQWQPIPVSYKSEAEEDIFHPLRSCPYKVNVLHNLQSTEDVQKRFIAPYQDVFHYVQKHSGKDINNPADMQDIFFILKTESDMGLIMPEWTQKIFPEPAHSISAQVYGYDNYDPRVRQINSGYMLKKILLDSLAKTQGQSDKKLFLYSGHESTVGYMLNSLKVFKKSHVPPYGSALSFEVHKRNDQYFMKLRYRNDTNAAEPVDLHVPGCDVLCPLQTFQELYKSLLPIIGIDEACERLNKPIV